jgi:hypothetical protein
VLSAFDAPLENSMRGRQIIGFIFLFVPGCVYTALPGLAQSQNTGFVHSGVTVSFENTSDYAVGAGVTVSFENTGNYAVGAGVSISFQNASDSAGRGVSVAFGSVPPATQITAAYGQPGTSRNPSGAVAEPVNTATGNY